MTDIEQAIRLATDVARTGALIEAEIAVRQRIDMLPMYKLSEVKALVNAANAIAALRGDS